MAHGIFLRDGANLVPMNETPYEAESILQALLADFPELLMGGEAGASTRYLLIDRELDVTIAGAASRRGFIDHIFVDERGVPTIIEVKRSANPEIRREVVGQMLDYAANLVAAWGLDGLRERFERRCGASSDASFAKAFPLEPDSNAFWKTVSKNLELGQFRLIFVADSVPDELRRIIEFLNSQMRRTEVLAVEVKQYLDGSGEHVTYVASIVGESEAADQAKGETGRKWDRESFLEKIAQVGEAETSAARRMIEWAEGRSDLAPTYGSGKQDGSFQIGHYKPGYLWPAVIYTHGHVELPFMYMLRRTPFDSLVNRQELRRRVETIDGVEFNTDGVEGRPRFSLAALADDASFESFVEAMYWALELADAAVDA